jgi:hypothetical protein
MIDSAHVVAALGISIVSSTSFVFCIYREEVYFDARLYKED